MWAFCPHFLGTASPLPRGHTGDSVFTLAGVGGGASMIEVCPTVALSYKAQVSSE